MSIQPSVIRKRARDKFKEVLFWCSFEIITLDPLSDEITRARRLRHIGDCLEKAFDEYDNSIATHERSIEERLSNLEKVLQEELASADARNGFTG